MANGIETRLGSVLARSLELRPMAHPLPSFLNCHSVWNNQTALPYLRLSWLLANAAIAAAFALTFGIDDLL